MKMETLLYVLAGFLAGKVADVSFRDSKHLGSILRKSKRRSKTQPVAAKIEQPFPPSYQYPTPDEVALQPSFNLLLYELSGRLER